MLALDLDDGDVLTVDRDSPTPHRVHSSPVGRGHVDAEMKRLAPTATDPRIPEHAAHRVLTIERLDRPRVSIRVGRHRVGTLTRPGVTRHPRMLGRRDK